jgi:hypothetical protein
MDTSFNGLLQTYLGDGIAKEEFSFDVSQGYTQVTGSYYWFGLLNYSMVMSQEFLTERFQ